MESETTPTVTTLSANDREALRGLAQWARMLAIIGFVMTGIMIVFAIGMSLLMGPMVDRAAAQQQQLLQEVYANGGTGGLPPEELMRHRTGPGTFFGGIYMFFVVVFGAIYLIPTVLLYRFAVRVRRVLDGPFDAPLFTSALHAHRRMYKFMGILTLVMLGLYLLVLIGAALFTTAMQQWRPPGG